MQQGASAPYFLQLEDNMWTREKEQRFQELSAEREASRQKQITEIQEFLGARDLWATDAQMEVLVEDANELITMLEPFKR